ncbi:MAG: beta-propeller domain-containing protein [Clostridiales bacterium]|jgi:uncharacterized secreted protein with C-terminal beta-propeller domain|nr:beta-propeller domain-containing protein [Clostridiales bacterium]
MKKLYAIGAVALIATLFGGAYLYSSTAAPATTPPPLEVAATPTVLNPAEPLGEKTSSAVMLFTGSSVAYINNEQVFVDPENPNTTPMILNGRTVVPLRFISEGFGAEISWNGEKRTAEIKISGKTIRCTAGSDLLTVNGETVPLDVPATMINDRIHLPLRAFADAIGKQVFYDEGLIIVSDTKNIYDPEKDQPTLDGIIAGLNNLPLIGSKERFLAIAPNLETLRQPRATAATGMMGEAVLETETAAIAMEDNFAPAPAADAPEAYASEDVTASPADTQRSDDDDSANADYSATNVQVAGVDEADIIKNDGKYIYYMRSKESTAAQKNTLSVVNAVPAEEMSVAYTVEFSDESFYPIEIYVDGDDMIVIGRASEEENDGEYPVYRDVTRAIIYDITDRQNVTETRRIEVEGYYMSSRKIDAAVYMITSVSAYSLLRGEEYCLPQYCDTNIQPGDIEIGYDRIYYYPEIANEGFTIVTGFKIDTPEDTAKINTYYGGGQNIYATRDALYVAAAGLSGGSEEPGAFIDTDALAPTTPVARDVLFKAEETDIYKFALNDGDVEYLYQASVPGRIINQFSMDESDGYFRIATTSYDKEYIEQNNLYVLDDTMTPVGQIEGIAPGEKIYSTRFMGDRAYMVTFKTVDPLFVIDLSEPSAPEILGELKIPGYSNYLHPYDETHLIGFGKDTMEQDGGAYYLGMKLSLFDVSDVSAPKELFSEIIGDRGTESDVLYNHKALLFSKEKGLLAFPVTITKASGSQQDSPWAYGEFDAQGAIVYDIDLENGFVKKGLISHGSVDYNNEDFVQRILYIGDTLYTVSNGKIQANDRSDLSETGAVTLD